MDLSRNNDIDLSAIARSFTQDRQRESFKNQVFSNRTSGDRSLSIPSLSQDKLYRR